MKTKTLLILTFLCVSIIGSTALAINPPPDGGYPNQNTAEGEDALFHFILGGGDNVAIGYRALFTSVGGQQNTAIGSEALYNQTESLFNMAIGCACALQKHHRPQQRGDCPNGSLRQYDWQPEHRYWLWSARTQH